MLSSAAVLSPDPGARPAAAVRGQTLKYDPILRLGNPPSNRRFVRNQMETKQ